MSNLAKKYFINIAGLHLGVPFLEDNWENDVTGIQELQQFLLEGDILTLYAVIELKNDNKRLKFFQRVTNNNYNNIVIFHKTKSSIPTDDNLLSFIQMTTLCGPPALSLYQSLNHIYLPLLKQNEQSNVEKVIANLQNNLRSLIFTQSAETKLIEATVDITSITVVSSLDHEIEFWNTINPSKRDRLTKTACATFKNILAPIAKDFSILEAFSINDVEDLIERTHTTLDDLWHCEPPYPIDRMRHLMDIIASEVWKFISYQLRKCDIWSSDYIEISDLLVQNLSLGKKWLYTCKQLTEIFWPNYSTHPWKEPYYEPSDLSCSIDLLQEILNIRIFHKQLTRLLTPHEQNELKTEYMFQSFKDIDVTVYGKDVTNYLQKARKIFEYAVQPAERRVAVKLKKQLSAVNANTRQLIYEFSRYSELLSRPILKEELLPERQYLLAVLFDYVKQIQMQATSEIIMVNTRHDSPEVVREITHIRQLEAKATEIHNISRKLLNDLQRYEELNQIVVQVIKDLEHQRNELFESWCAEIITYIKGNTLSLKETDPVVQFSKRKLMQVNYSPRLVILLSEVRQLRAMGYHIPSIIEVTSANAKKFIKHARILEQVANFHNTIGDRMIPCQKPMMLASALQLSKLVQEQEVVSWIEEKEVEKYVDILKNAVEKLSKENSLLTAHHHQVINKIRDLEQIDLIKDYSKWKETIKHVRNTMIQIEDKGFRNLQSWKNDLDKELAHVLEKKYLESLEVLHLYLPEIHIDMVYRNVKLEYSPDEDNLKKIYEQQLRKFLDIPKMFKGISDKFEDSLFKEIIQRNEASLKKVDMHTDDLFQQLKRVIEHWQSWLIIESLDVNKLTSWQAWDIHFRSSKTFGQEIAKLPSSEERVGCFIISLSRLRSDLESHNRSYWDQLVHSLKDSIAQDVVKLQDYVNHSTAALTRQPLTIEEVGDSGITHENILKEVPVMQKIFDEMTKKSQILSAWSREQVEAANRLKGAWDRLQILLNNHQHIIAKQMETIRTTLNVEKENIEKELERFSAKWEEVKPRPLSRAYIDNSMKDMMGQLECIKKKRAEWNEVVEKKDKLLNDCTRFNIDLPNFELVEVIENDLSKEEEAWSIFEEFQGELNELLNETWIVFRKKIYLIEDFSKKWNNRLMEVEKNQLVTRISQEINNYEAIAPLLKFVKGDDYSEKHWLETFTLLGMEAKPIDQLMLSDFLGVSSKIEEHIKELQSISKKAASEIIIHQALSELDQWDVQCRFILMSHKDSRNQELSLIRDFKEILNKIGDHQSLLQSVKNSADYETFSDKANMWENKLGNLEHYLTSLAQVQRKWLYLEPIFGGGTLAQEKVRFDRIDRDFKYILNSIEKDTRVGALCRYPNLRSLLEGLLDQLLKCQNSLDNFLKVKREKFPRFLFLSDDDLLEVIGQSSKEQIIQTHLKKMFAGINNVRLDESGQNIIAICSSEGELVNLTNRVNIQRPVEEWLEVLVKQMQMTLKELLVECQHERLAPDPLKYPSQILCLADTINFTLKCEQAISSMTLPQLLEKYKVQLSHYSSLELNNGKEGEDVSTNTNNILEIKLKALLLDTIHNISVLETLIENKVMKISDWIWQRQLRYYANSTGEVTVKMANSRMEYSYEYLGNSPKLVRTTLTDRCFLTLTQSIHLGMGGNLYGPAGTGKTETVKALGALLGRQVLVFNCDEGIDAISMGRILMGLVKTGAWGCFDEFNRLDEATLSTISMIIHPIQEALRTQQNLVYLIDQEIPVNKHCGIFITLNPAGGDYGGRNELPDNLKQLFRPVVMTHPDNAQIARSLLHCDGYEHADSIAEKLIEVFDLSSKLLSEQKHYDWGLRSIRTVLGGCGRALKKFKLKKVQDTNALGLNLELGIISQVLRMNTLSKLSYADTIRFNLIVSDIFGNSLEMDKDEVLKNYLEECFSELGIIKNQKQINKCLELFEQLQQRMGVAIVGPPHCGKSTIRNLMQRALTKMNKTIKLFAFNPKSMSRARLLGKTDSDTNQWNEGVLTNYSIQAASESSDIWTWIVCDGEIDPEWVESLNSVLDDNRLFSLPSGWRIQFKSNVNFIFETQDLAHASPATISRMGIVFLSEQDLDLENYVSKFTNNLPDDQKFILEPIISEHFSKAVNWITSEGEITIPSSKLAIAESGLKQLVNVKSRAHFSVSLINGLGQQLQEDFRELFAQQVYDWTGVVSPSLILKSHYNSERDIVDSYYTNPNITIENISCDLPLVYTGQISLYSDVLKVWLLHNANEHILIVGEHGSAKTLLLHTLVAEITDAELITFHCTGNLMPTFVINKLTQHCLQVNTHKGKVFKPKKGRLILHFKNIHLLKPDKWGTSMLIEFLNQLIVYKGFFDSNVEFIGIENISIVGSLVQTNSLSKRFTSHLRIFNVNLPEHEDFSIIVSTYLSKIIKDCFPNQNWPKAKTVKLAVSMISIYDKIRNILSPNNKKHYVFSPHEVTNWCKAISRYNNDSNMDFELFILEVICYEAFTIFCDKLTGDQEKHTVYKIIDETLKSQWGGADYVDKLLGKCYYVPTENNSSKLSKLAIEDWTNTIKSGIRNYEREGQILNLLVTTDLLRLTAIIAKCLSNPGGNILLIGKSGVSRKSSSKIVSALQSAKLICLRNDQQPQFNNDLKAAMHCSALDGEEVYLQIEDHILNKDINLDTINSLISSYEIPSLYTEAEIDGLVKVLKDDSDRENFEGSLIQYFAERVRRKLHMVISLDIDNQNLWHIIQNCPCFTQNCVIVWISDWSNETIECVPKLLLQNNTDEDKVKLSCIENFTKIYRSTKSSISTPSRFISMIRLYENILEDKLTVIKARQGKLQAGVAKLNEAKSLVKLLSQEAVEQQSKLEEKQTKANAALDMISNTMKSANSHKEEMKTLEKKTQLENEQLIKRKEEIEQELAEVEPLIQEARAAIGNIKSESLTEIRSLRAPPEIIRDILEGVLRLMGIQDTSWNSMKIFLAKRGVKEEIRSFDARRIMTENRQAVQRLITVKGESFDPKTAKRASIAAAPLAAWVTANVKYSQVMDKIKPLEIEQNKLKQNLNEAEVYLTELSAGLLDVDTTVAKLKQQLSDYTKEAAEVEIGLNKVNETLNAAEGLVSKLTDEFERWQHQLEELSEQLEKLPKDCLLAAAFMTYLPSEMEDKRMEFMRTWSKDFVENYVGIELFFSSEREHIQWQSEGLSSDKLSIQNAIIILKGNIVPLLIDPTSLATNWIKQHMKHKNVECSNQNSPKFNSLLELAVRFGKVFIVEEIDEICPAILELLNKELICQGERQLIKLNGKLMDYHSDFKLILCTRDEQLLLPSYIAPLVNLMNFTVTHTGLTEQLLSGAVRQENPQLEHKKKQSLRDKEELEEKQYQLQNQLLEDLANSKGDILQDSRLLESLNKTKASSEAIGITLNESTELQAKLQSEYEVYRAISNVGSTLYFACNEFGKKNVLYLVSVSAFTTLFLRAMKTFQGLENNFELQKKHILQAVYDYMSRGIFKCDRLKFLLHLSRKLFPKEIVEDEWNSFLGNTVTHKTAAEEIPVWIPKQNLHSVQNLQMSLPDFYESLQLNNMNSWNEFMSANDCLQAFPGHCKLTNFQKILVVQALRSDRLYSTTTQCVLRITGLKSLEPPVLNLLNIYKESNYKEPVLVLAVSGTDPLSEIKQLCQTLQNVQYTEVAMGEGQESKALNALKKCAESGSWLILKNLHLVTNWLSILSQNLKNMDAKETFRLWLVSEPTPNFNSVLAQNSLKVVYETSQGMKNNILKTYATYGNKYFDKLNHNSAKIFFAISCVHALLQERRKYIPQGWSKCYDFSDTDLSTIIKLVEDLWHNQTTQIQWSFISGLCSDAVYGGRIENINDMNILASYTQQYFTDEILSHYWRPFGLNISLPSNVDFEEYLKIIKQLPDKDEPSIFGLTENIDRAWERQSSSKIILELKNFCILESIFNTFDTEIFYKRLSPFMTLWKKINQGHDFLRMTPETDIEKKTMVEMFLLEEFNCALNLIQIIHKSFANFKKISKGSVVPDEVDLTVYNSLLNYETPKLWLNSWNGPKEPIKFLRSTMDKTVGLYKWKNQEIHKLLSTPLALSTLFHPEAFLAAHKLDFARSNNVAIDELALQTSWKIFSTGSLILTNILIEGALLENGILKHCRSNSENINNVSECSLAWVHKKDILQDGDIINVPLYTTSTRQKNIIFLKIPCEQKATDKWIQSGLAFYLEY